MVDITRPDRFQMKKAAEVSARAFFSYPMMRFYFPNEQKRARYLPWYMGLVHKCGLRYGDVYIVPDNAGTAGFLPPGHTRISFWEYMLNGFSIAPLVWGWKDYGRVLECEACVEKAHDEILQDRPHYYLWWLTVDPDQQEKGIGTALLQPGLAKADAEKVPIYLETHEEKNVAYYQKRGFELARMETVPKYNLPFWCMLREPC